VYRKITSKAQLTLVFVVVGCGDFIFVVIVVFGAEVECFFGVGELKLLLLELELLLLEFLKLGRVVGVGVIVFGVGVIVVGVGVIIVGVIVFGVELLFLELRLLLELLLELLKLWEFGVFRVVGIGVVRKVNYKSGNL